MKKKDIICQIALPICALIMTTGVLIATKLPQKSEINTANLYPKSTIVTDIEGDKIIVVDFNGNYWSFTDIEETWAKGDICSLIMHDNNTSDTIYDDIIIKAQYSGYLN